MSHEIQVVMSTILRNIIYSMKVYESLLKELNGRNVIVEPDDVKEYLQRWGIREADMADILQRVESIPSNQLDNERKARFITFLKGTKHQASLNELKAALVSEMFFFSLQFLV